MSSPDKLYRSIGEAGRLLRLQPHVLRYWEQEFGQLRPRRTAAGRRQYRSEDIQLLRVIRRLVHEEGYSIDGARRQLATICRKDSTERVLAETRRGLEKVLNILDGGSGTRVP